MREAKAREDVDEDVGGRKSREEVRGMEATIREAVTEGVGT